MATVIVAWIVVGIGFNVAGFFGVAVSWWERIHPFTLGALTTAIIVYSTHFTEALTRTAASSHRGVAVRVCLVQVAAVALLVQRAGLQWGTLGDAAAITVIGALCWQAFFVLARLRGSLAGTFAVTAVYYVLAAALMMGGVALAAWSGHDSRRAFDLIAAHSRAMVWGSALLTVLGTTVTLLPTLAGTTISSEARRRCARGLVLYCAALTASVVCYAAGAHVAAGCFLLVVVVAGIAILHPTLATVIGAGSRWTFSTLSVVAGVVWLVALCAGDAAGTIAGADTRRLTALLLPAVIAGGLLQLVIGVLAHLLPVMLGGGPSRVRCNQGIAQTAGPARLVLTNLGSLQMLVGAVETDRTAGAFGAAWTGGLITLGISLVTAATLLLFMLYKHYQLESTC